MSEMKGDNSNIRTVFVNCSRFPASIAN